MTSSPQTSQPFTATVTGSPRIGPKRELKRATEGYWAGRTSRSDLESVASTLRHDTWSHLAEAGLDSVPVNTFSYYDQMLDTAVMLGALPARVAEISDDLDRYFAAARGNKDVAPLEMTKWFDTNYHYIVPEIEPATQFTLNPDKVLSELKEALGQGIPARPVVIGPVTFLLLSKAVNGGGAPIERLQELVPVYSELLSLLADNGAQWVQLDEPALVTDISPDAPALAEAVYNALGALSNRPAIYVATYFGDPGASLAALARTPVEAIGVDLVYGGNTAVAAVPELASKTLVAGVVDGRNIWRTDLQAALSKLATLLGSAANIAVSTSCSTLHVPYSLEPETGLDDALRSWLAFGEEKVHEVAVLARALQQGSRSRRRRDRGVQRRGRLPQEGPAPAQRPGPGPHRLDRQGLVRTAATRHSGAKARTPGCICRRCRPRRSARSRRPSRSARPAPRWSPVRSTRPSTTGG